MKWTFSASLLLCLMLSPLAVAQSRGEKAPLPQLSATEPVRSQLDALDRQLVSDNFAEMGVTPRATTRRLAREIREGIEGQPEDITLDGLPEPQRSRFLAYHEEINKMLRKGWMDSIVSCRNVHQVGTNRPNRKCMSNAARRANEQDAREVMINAVQGSRIITE